MSFTVMRYKNGVAAPIKMSIWDAFKGAPEPKYQQQKTVSCGVSVNQPDSAQVFTPSPSIMFPDVLVECARCRHASDENDTKTNAKDEKKGDGKKSGDGKDKNSDKGGTKDDKQGQSRSTREQETYSKEDDEKIIELKQKDTSWKEILAAIDKESLSQLKEHWKQINPENQDDKDDQDISKDTKSTKGKDSKNSEGKKQDTDKDSQSKKKQKQEGKPKKDNNDEKDESELRSWSDRYDRQKWIAAASRHFDLTGRRITPATAKKLAESK